MTWAKGFIGARWLATDDSGDTLIYTAEIRGVKQSPMHGVSFAHTLNDPDASTGRHTQYFEMLGHRSIYHDGWRAVCPWPGPSFTEAGMPFGQPITSEMLSKLDATGWELYHVDEDFAEAQKLGRPLTEYARSKHKFAEKQAELTAADQKRINELVEEKYKVREAELAAKYGSNPDTRSPMPSKFDRVIKEAGVKGDSWKSPEGREANRRERLKKFENLSVQ